MLKFGSWGWRDVSWAWYHLLSCLTPLTLSGWFRFIVFLNRPPFASVLEARRTSMRTLTLFCFSVVFLLVLIVSGRYFFLFASLFLSSSALLFFLAHCFSTCLYLFIHSFVYPVTTFVYLFVSRLSLLIPPPVYSSHRLLLPVPFSVSVQSVCLAVSISFYRFSSCPAFRINRTRLCKLLGKLFWLLSHSIF